MQCCRIVSCTHKWHMSRYHKRSPSNNVSNSAKWLPADYSNYSVRKGVTAFQHQSIGNEGKLQTLLFLILHVTQAILSVKMQRCPCAHRECIRGLEALWDSFLNSPLQSCQLHTLGTSLPKTELKVLGGPQSRWVDLSKTHTCNPSQESNHDLNYKSHSKVTTLTMLSWFPISSPKK